MYRFLTRLGLGNNIVSLHTRNNSTGLDCGGSFKTEIINLLEM